MAAEACTELGADSTPPIGRPPVAFLLAPFFDRWPRFSVLACLIVLLALLGFASEPPPAELPVDEVRDGIPSELLAATCDNRAEYCAQGSQGSAP